MSSRAAARGKAAANSIRLTSRTSKAVATSRASPSRCFLFCRGSRAARSAPIAVATVAIPPTRKPPQARRASPITERSSAPGNLMGGKDTSGVAGHGSFDGQASWGRRRVLPCQQQRGRGGGRDCRSSSARMSASVHDAAWDLTLADRPLVEAKRWANRLRFAVMLLFFRARGRFPRVAAEVNGAAVAKLARSLGVPEPGSGEPLLPDAADRTAERQRAEIRALLGFREAGIADAEALGAWLRDHGVARTRDPVELAAEAEARCRTLCIEPLASDRIARIVRTAVRAYEDRRTAVIHARLTPAMRINLDALLQPAGSEGTGDAEDGAVPDGRADAPLVHLRAGPGRASVASLRDALARLGTIRRISLPADLFTDWSLRELEACRQRVAVEAPHELRRHPEATRHVWLAAYAHLRGRAVTDTLVDLLIETVHHIGARAEHKVEQELLDDLKRVGGKQSLLFDLAGAAVEKPDGTVREVLFPVVGEQTLRDLVRESKATGPTYRTTLRATIRSSYRGHYRRAVLDLLAVLDFRSNNDVHRPVIRALDLIRRYAETRLRAYPVEEDVPLDGIVRPLWRDAVVDQDPQGRPRIDRITYEICALEALRDQLRCKEVWVAGANRYRNPDEDLPADFDAQRAGHYQALDLPLDASAFIDGLREEVHAALAQLDQGLPRNPDVRITSKRGGWISLTPLLPRPSPANIEALKAEVADTWPPTPGRRHLAADEPARHRQGGRPAAGLHRPAPQLHGLRGARPRGSAATPAVVPQRPRHQRRTQAHERHPARRHLQGPALRPSALCHSGPAARGHRHRGQWHAQRP